MPRAGQVRSSAEKLAARIADWGHTSARQQQPPAGPRSTALHTSHRAGVFEDEVVILSALLGRNVWQYGELQSIAVLVWCCKARGWGGVPGLGVGAGSV